MIASQLQAFLLILSLALLAHQVQAVTSSEVGHILLDNYDDGSEMNQRIILEFMASEICQQRCPDFDKSSLLNNFETFRSEWVDKMISYVISELGIDAESARHVRRNPANYKINY